MTPKEPEVRMSGLEVTGVVMTMAVGVWLLLRGLGSALAWYARVQDRRGA